MRQVGTAQVKAALCRAGLMLALPIVTLLVPASGSASCVFTGEEELASKYFAVAYQAGCNPQNDDTEEPADEAPPAKIVVDEGALSDDQAAAVALLEGMTDPYSANQKAEDAKKDIQEEVVEDGDEPPPDEPADDGSSDDGSGKGGK